MRKLTFFFTLISALIMAQETELNEADVILDDLFAADSLEIFQLVDEIKKQDYLYATVMYNGKTLFSGRDFGVDQYSVYPAISYIDANNFFLNVSSGYFSGISPKWDFVTYSAGYSNYIDKKKSLTVTGIYSYSSFSQDIANLNNQRLTTSLSFRNKGFRNSLSAGYLFGGTNTNFVSNNTYFSIDLLDTKSMDISLQPRLGLFWGNQTVTELVQINANATEEVNTDYFQLLNTEVSVPLEFDFGSWDIELEYTFSIPNPLPGEEELENIGFFSISLGYLIGL